MPAAYSLDLREKVVQAYERKEGTQKAIAQRFSISSPTVQSYWYLKRDTGSLEPKQGKRGQKPAIGETGLLWLASVLRKRPELTLQALCARYKRKYRVKVSLSMMCRACQKLGLTRKKKSLYASEQDRPDIKKARSIYLREGPVVSQKPDHSR